MSSSGKTNVASQTVSPDNWMSVISNAQDAMYILDRSGNFLDVNQRLCAGFRLPREKIIGTSVTVGLEKEHVALANRVLREIIEKRRSFRSTRCYAFAGCDPQTFETIETPLIRDGDVWAIAGIARDISEEVTLERKLWDTIEDKQSALDFSLRTSLGLVKGYIYTLGETDMIDAEQWYRYIQIIEEEIDHLTYLIEDVLDFRRMEDKQSNPTSDVVDLRECVEMTLSQFREEAARREMELATRIPERIDPLFISRDAVNRVLLNLVLSAMHRTMHSGRIEVEIEDHEEYVDITVCDNGVPIEETELPYVFEKFYRGKDGSGTDQSAGLGLAITRMLVTAMGGKIWADKKSEQGNAFHVMLPRRLFLGEDQIETQSGGTMTATLEITP
jgi:two-component system phosphate regulon sensor histidine kinase PhoR